MQSVLRPNFGLNVQSCVTKDNKPIDPNTAYKETKALRDADQEVSVHATPPTFLFNTLQRPWT